MKIYIGCSGFSYKEWKDVFYPGGLPARLWLDYYTKKFNTLEINSSFYRIPTEKTINNWYAKTPDDFIFSVKGPRFVTHIKRFKIDQSVINDFTALMQNGLKHKLGCILYQMPPSFHFSEERLNLILQKLDPSVRNVVEFRHKSWWVKNVYDAFKKHQITFCGQSYPGDIPEDVIQNHSTVYYRFHGKPVLYKSQYDEIVLKEVASQIKKSKKEVYIYFNNTWGTAAITNAQQTQKIMDGL